MEELTALVHRCQAGVDLSADVDRSTRDCRAILHMPIPFTIGGLRHLLNQTSPDEMQGICALCSNGNREKSQSRCQNIFGHGEANLLAVQVCAKSIAPRLKFRHKVLPEIGISRLKAASSTRYEAK
jgi:hypothetical protein